MRCSAQPTFMSLISFRTKIPLNAAHLPNITDYLIWYAADKGKVKFRRLHVARNVGADTLFSSALLPTDEIVDANKVPDKYAQSARYVRLIDLVASGYGESCHFEFYLHGRRAYPNPTTSWKTTPAGMARLIMAGRVRWLKTTPGYVFFADDYPVVQITSQWVGTQDAIGKTYVVQTADKIVQRCLLMTTDPGDLVFDPTCVSRGTRVWVCRPSSAVFTPTLTASGEGASPFPPRAGGCKGGSFPPRAAEYEGASFPLPSVDTSGPSSPARKGIQMRLSGFYKIPIFLPRVQGDTWGSPCPHVRPDVRRAHSFSLNGDMNGAPACGSNGDAKAGLSPPRAGGSKGGFLLSPTRERKLRIPCSH